MTAVLIVDDEPAVRDVFARWVTSFGLTPHSAASAEDALAMLRTQRCDLAVVDLNMPGRDGLWLVEQMHREHPQMAVVIATARADLVDARAHDCADLLVKPFHRARFQIAVDRGRYWHQDAVAERQWTGRLAIEVSDGFDGIMRDVMDRIVRAGLDDVAAVTAMSADRIPRTLAHSERVERYIVAMTRALGTPALEARLIAIAARFHDVGKAAMPLAILTKPSKLTEGEVAIMQRHVGIGADLLASLPGTADAAPIVRASHEWFGGGGYPLGLRGQQIPLGSRLIAVADAYDAITQGRVYHRAVESAHAVSELMRCCPSQFDSDLVDVFIQVLSRH